MGSKRVCVFCGSKKGASPIYQEAAREFGSELAKQGKTLVFGGGNVGLMGIVADAVLAGGGQAIGVMPEILVEREIAHQGLTELHIVPGMAERKERMIQLADSFVAFPGGLGTLDELFEVLTLAQIGQIAKPGFRQRSVGLLNISGFYDELLNFLERIQGEDFVTLDLGSVLRVDSTPEGLLRALG